MQITSIWRWASIISRQSTNFWTNNSWFSGPKKKRISNSWPLPYAQGTSLSHKRLELRTFNPRANNKRGCPTWHECDVYLAYLWFESIPEVFKISSVLSWTPPRPKFAKVPMIHYQLPTRCVILAGSTTVYTKKIQKTMKILKTAPLWRRILMVTCCEHTWGINLTWWISQPLRIRTHGKANSLPLLVIWGYLSWSSERGVWLTTEEGFLYDQGIVGLQARKSNVWPCRSSRTYGVLGSCATYRTSNMFFFPAKLQPEKTCFGCWDAMLCTVPLCSSWCVTRVFLHLTASGAS